MSDCKDDDPRARLVARALGEVGKQDPIRYWAEVHDPSWNDFQVRQFAKHQPWCGGFYLWALVSELPKARGIYWRMGLGFAAEHLLQLVPEEVPEPGDLAYYDQPWQHHAMVERVEGHTVFTIDGNQAGSTVAQRARPLSKASLYYSIEGLL